VVVATSCSKTWLPTNNQRFKSDDARVQDSVCSADSPGFSLEGTGPDGNKRSLLLALKPQADGIGLAYNPNRLAVEGPDR
jgi:hypothetical protein